MLGDSPLYLTILGNCKTLQGGKSLPGPRHKSVRLPGRQVFPSRDRRHPEAASSQGCPRTDEDLRFRAQVLLRQIDRKNRRHESKDSLVSFSRDFPVKENHQQVYLDDEEGSGDEWIPGSGDLRRTVSCQYPLMEIEDHSRLRPENDPGVPYKVTQPLPTKAQILAGQHANRAMYEVEMWLLSGEPYVFEVTK